MLISTHGRPELSGGFFHEIRTLGAFLLPPQTGAELNYELLWRDGPGPTVAQLFRTSCINHTLFMDAHNLRFPLLKSKRTSGIPRVTVCL